MRILVTGGSGFIGSALTRRLIADGHSVTNLDLRAGARRGKVHDITGDVRDRELMTRLCARADVVYHLASRVGVRHYLNQHRDTLTTILDGAINVVDGCVLSGARLIMASTSEVYGKGVSLPMSEDGDVRYGPTDRRRWAYGMSKALAEQVALNAVAGGHLDARIFRPFNVVGPEQSPEGGLVFPAFAAQTAAGGPILVHGSGEQTRTFLGIDDLLDGLLRLTDLPDIAGTVLNLGSPTEYTVADVAAEFAAAGRELLGLTVPIEHVAYETVYPSGFEDTLRRVPDTAAAERLIGWRPADLRPLPALVRDALAAIAAAQPHALAVPHV